MLNKPKGYLCANKDEKEKCVVDLIDYLDCFCLGRLDRDTTGLLILTNDKSLKKLLLPQNHVKKTYLVETKEKLKKEDQEVFKRESSLIKVFNAYRLNLKFWMIFMVM